MKFCPECGKKLESLNSFNACLSCKVSFPKIPFRSIHLRAEHARVLAEIFLKKPEILEGPSDKFVAEVLHFFKPCLREIPQDLGPLNDLKIILGAISGNILISEEERQERILRIQKFFKISG